MKFFKSLLIALIIMANLLIAQPSLADRPKFTKNPDYIEVTKALDELSKAKDTQAVAGGPTTEQIQNRIAELEFQKYALETGVNWAQCRNETGKTLVVYGPLPDSEDDDYESPYDNALYLLANGQTTKQNWDCDGVYLPNDVKITALGDNGKNQEWAGPGAVKILDGTQLVIKTNPNTAALEFSAPTKLVKAGEAKWFIPNVAQAFIDKRVPNAPVAKSDKYNRDDLVAQKNQESAVVQSNTAFTTQPEPQAKSQTSLQKKLIYGQD